MRRKLLSLLSDSMIFGASTALAQLIQFLLLPLLTEYLTTADYGVLDILNIFMSLYLPLANIGMSNAIFRRFNTCQDEAGRRDVISTGMVSVLVSTTIFGAIAFALARPLTTWIIGDPGLTWLTCLTIVAAMLASLQNMGTVVLRAERRVRTVAILNIISLLATIGSTVFLVTVFDMGVAGAVIGTLFGAVCYTLVTLWAIWSQFSLTWKRQTWNGMFSYGFPLVPHHVMAVVLAVFGQIVITKWLGPSDTGLYGMAMKFSMPFAFIVNSIQKAWVPFKFQIHAEEQADSPAFFRSVVTYYVAATTYLWVGVCLWGPLLIILMTTQEFHSAAWLIPVTALIPFSQGLYFMLGTGIELGENTRSMPLVSGAGLAMVVVGSLVLVPQWGPGGAAIASCLGWGIMTVLIYIFSQRQFRVHYDWGAIIALAVVALATVGLNLIARDELDDWAIVGVAVLLSLAYPAVALLILMRSATERHRVWALVDLVKSYRNRKGKKKPKSPPPAEDDSSEDAVTPEEPAEVDATP